MSCVKPKVNVTCPTSIGAKTHISCEQVHVHMHVTKARCVSYRHERVPRASVLDAEGCDKGLLVFDDLGIRTG